jgi:Leucine-rich repeat (LRR) protein
MGNCRNLVNSAINATNIPSEIGLLPNLTEFQVWSTTADGGTIPTELGNCDKLKVLVIQGSDFIREIPTELGKLTNLRRLILEGGLLSGLVPTELGLLTNLTWLSIALNDLSGQLPNELGNLKQLSILEVHYNSLIGSIPSGLCNEYVSIDRSCPITECDCCRNPCRKN